MNAKKQVAISLLLVATAGVSSQLMGCAGAVVAGAGVVGGIAYTDRGAKGEVKGNVKQINDASKKAFEDMNIRVTGANLEKSGQERTLDGKSNRADVTVKMAKSTANTTQVEVIAKESTLKWNKDYAKEILAKIASE